MTTTQTPRPISGGEEDGKLCRHHWVIEAPNGPISMGECRTCGETREFKNFIESAPWSEGNREPGVQERIKVTMPTDDAGDSDEQ